MQETFLTEFEKRGYFSQCTDRSGLDDIMSKGKIKTYIGFDCTAPSLHVGSLMQIMCLRLLQKYGHQPIVLLGGGTTLIGDPSGKEETRKILSKKTLPTGMILNELLHDYVIGSPTYVIRKKSLDSLDYHFNKHFHIIGDFDLNLRLAAKWKIDCVQDPVATARIHGQNVSLLNKNNQGKGFGLFATSGKSTSFVGPLLVSTVTFLTASQRIGFSAAIILLLSGLIILLNIKKIS